MASTSLDALELAESVNAPPVVLMLRANCAVTSSLRTATPTEAPMATLSLFASASALVVKLPVCAAEIVTSPAAEIIPPEPT